MGCHLSKNQRQNLNPGWCGAKAYGLWEVWLGGEEIPVPGGYFKDAVRRCRAAESRKRRLTLGRQIEKQVHPLVSQHNRGIAMSASLYTPGSPHRLFSETSEPSPPTTFLSPLASVPQIVSQEQL